MRTVTVNEVPSDAQLIDVREPEEYAEVHAANAVNIPLSELTTRYQEINPDREIYVICRSGGRSAQACEYFERALGWEEPINVEGGTIAWQEAHLPTA
ncbi:rhodanese-like domain-containing protein [Corynebacterium timonense]|uniref:Rhodanese-related sulfurtransferase n=1 Tax=Corynebacterium timonense TaxID=441500 RepID=A0A1H1L3K7_9CORY|nr:rhodanese-like domain-containing protein [Corynebacterium timonense]SDR69073.1 Rhodanese-related sulfurtransferase [Corynebacterium timonense]